MGSLHPIIGGRYRTSLTSTAEVIAVGTQGVVVEFPDGRVQLINITDWQAMHYQPLEGQARQQRAG